MCALWWVISEYSTCLRLVFDRFDLCYGVDMRI